MKLHPNIEIKLNTKVDVDTLRALNPDQVIVSPGGGIIPIDVPGIDGKNVVKSEDIKAMCNGIVPEGKGMIWKAAVAAIKAQGGTVGFMRMGLNMKSGPTAIVGKRVVVVGGGFAGLEVAEAMCDGREIWVIDPAKKLGNGIGIIDKNPTINLLKKKGVHLMPLTELIEVTKKGAKDEERRDRRGAAHRVRHRADLPRRGAEHRPVRRDREGVAAREAHRRRYHPRRQGVPHPRGRQGRLPGLHGHLNGLIPGYGRWVETARRPLSQFGSNAQAF